jgi:Kef-type K+ transport system membrane component KefB
MYPSVNSAKRSAMQHLSPHDVMTMFMALATLLGCAKLAAELMQKIGQPPILGEISVGIFLGPTVLGHYRPHLYETLFPTTGPMPIVLDTVTTLGVVFFLLTAGLEIDLHSIFRQGKSALLVRFSTWRFLLPLASWQPKFFPATWARKRVRTL